MKKVNYKLRNFIISIRPEYKGRHPRRDYSSIQGKEVRLQHIGWQNEDENYPGEEMLMPSFIDKKMQQFFRDNDIIWIASGDVTELNTKTN